MCSLEWLGRLKCRATGLDASLSSFSTSRRCSRNRSPNRLPVSPMYSFLHNVQVMQVLHRERAHLKVPGFSIVLNVLLARKLPTFLSRLNEISGGWENAFNAFMGIMLQMPRTLTKKTLGDRAFLAAAPKLWNGLPSQIRNEPNFHRFT